MTVFIDPAGIVQGVSYGPLSEAGFQDQMELILPKATGSPQPAPASPGPSPAASPAVPVSPAA
jgi:hypothetical protein